MRLAIIGGGFFGHHIAEELTRTFPSATVEIFEMENRPLLGAGTINQCRLHLGFHYPRSGYTIYQSVMGYDRFIERYPEFVNDVTDNLYAVHRDGLSTAEQYLAVMDSFSLPYEKVPVSRELFREPDKIDLVIRVPEKSIDVNKVRRKLSERFPGKVYLGVKIVEIDASSGMLRSEVQEYGPYAYVINATYTDPNLGLPESKRFLVKHELTALPLCKTSLPGTSAITIMDGGFVSVYPAYGGMHTLWSVKYGPFRLYGRSVDLQAEYPDRYQLAEQDDAIAKICRTVEEHVNIKYEIQEIWVTAKTKLATDKGDTRVTEVRRHERLLSVLCGKLDAVFGASDAILKEIR